MTGGQTADCVADFGLFSALGKCVDGREMCNLDVYAVLLVVTHRQEAAGPDTSPTSLLACFCRPKYSIEDQTIADTEPLLRPRYRSN